MNLLEEVAGDEFYFIQDTVYLRIMLRTGDLDWIYIYRNDLVEIFRKLDRIAPDLNQPLSAGSTHPTKCINDCDSLTFIHNESC